ncbi:hypothetical protein ABT288_27435 [Streptomyces sp. NPDC001093]|uniref:hypothetical protein n=1 Tax=Streptomyces sp. NPDC001093 TaxID=3154376 RepID=UPI0033177272
MYTHMDRSKNVILQTGTVGAAVAFALAVGVATAASAGAVPLTAHVTPEAAVARTGPTGIHRDNENCLLTVQVPFCLGIGE